MMLVAILFSVTAVGGLALLATRLRGANPPLPIAMLHGLLAAGSLVWLVVQVVATKATGLPVFAIGLFVAGAGLGVYMVSQHVKGRLIPIGMVFVHGLTVALALALLWGYVLAP